MRIQVRLPKARKSGTCLYRGRRVLPSLLSVLISLLTDVLCELGLNVKTSLCISCICKLFTILFPFLKLEVIFIYPRVLDIMLVPVAGFTEPTF